jgi:hypothetical protein
MDIMSNNLCEVAGVGCNSTILNDTDDSVDSQKRLPLLISYRMCPTVVTRSSCWSKTKPDPSPRICSILEFQRPVRTTLRSSEAGKAVIPRKALLQEGVVARLVSHM